MDYCRQNHFEKSVVVDINLKNDLDYYRPIILQNNIHNGRFSKMIRATIEITVFGSYSRKSITLFNPYENTLENRNSNIFQCDCDNISFN
jgi:hypothetical protein